MSEPNFKFTMLDGTGTPIITPVPIDVMGGGQKIDLDWFNGQFAFAASSGTWDVTIGLISSEGLVISATAISSTYSRPSIVRHEPADAWLILYTGEWMHEGEVLLATMDDSGVVASHGVIIQDEAGFATGPDLFSIGDNLVILWESEATGHLMGRTLSWPIAGDYPPASVVLDPSTIQDVTIYRDRLYVLRQDDGDQLVTILYPGPPLVVVENIVMDSLFERESDQPTAKFVGVSERGYFGIIYKFDREFIEQPPIRFNLYNADMEPICEELVVSEDIRSSAETAYELYWSGDEFLGLFSVWDSPDPGTDHGIWAQIIRPTF